MENGASDLWPVRVLFLCWHNDLRSQLAKAVLRHRGPGQFLAHSAGIVPTRIHPSAIAALACSGIKSAGQYAKDVGALAGKVFDVVTLCERTRAVPHLPAAAAVCIGRSRTRAWRVAQMHSRQHASGCARRSMNGYGC